MIKISRETIRNEVRKSFPVLCTLCFLILVCSSISLYFESKHQQALTKEWKDKFSESQSNLKESEASREKAIKQMQASKEALKSELNQENNKLKEQIYELNDKTNTYENQFYHVLESAFQQKGVTGQIKEFDKTYYHADGSASVQYHYELPIIWGNTIGIQKINRSLKQDCDETIANWLTFYENYGEDDVEPISICSTTLSLSTSISYNENSILSFLFSSSTYDSGAAHPLWGRFGQTFDVRTGEEITLQKLFNLDEKSLNRLITEAFREENTKYEKGWKIDTVSLLAGYNTNFVIMPEGIYFFFNPYDIASYAAGCPGVLIPFQDLKDSINPVFYLEDGTKSTFPKGEQIG